MYENDGFHPYEDNNDAQNRYEAQSSETSGNQWQQPLYQMPQQPEHTQPKKKHTAGRVVALALCCSLLGGAVGAGAMAIGTSMTGTSGGSRSSSTSTILQGDRPTSAINVSKIDTSKEMTAAEVYAANVNSTVGITTSITTNYWGYQTQSAAAGSGFILTADGYILTNYHVVEDSNSITVSLYDGSSYDAKLIGYDENNDIAVLKIDATGLQPVVLGSSDDLHVGDQVVAIGNPLGELTFSLTTGVVSALDRPVTLSTGTTMNLIQTDFLRYCLRYITSVASQHHSLRNTSPLQSLDRIFHTILDAICNDDRAQESAIFCHIYNCTYRIALRIRNSFLIHQLAIAC